MAEVIGVPISALSAERLRRVHVHGQAYVYFVRSGPSGAIKIGSTRDLVARFLDLQIGNPEQLYYLASFDVPGVHVRRAEAMMHSEFAEARIRGEWFAPTSDLLDAIEYISHGGDVRALCKQRLAS